MYYDYSYSFNDGEILGVILFYVIYMLAACGFSVAVYVLRSLGVYTIAKRRGLKHAWFAWVPVVDYYLLGCISDQYRYVVKGQNKNKRKWLLALNIVFMALLTVTLVSFVGIAVKFAMGYVSENRMMSQMLGTMGLYLPLLGISIAMAVVRFMALHDLYVSCDPKNSTMYLVLSILIGVTEPFFIFFNRKKDEGMPPRREEPKQESAAWKEPELEAPVWEAPKAEQEDPWVNE